MKKNFEMEWELSYFKVIVGCLCGLLGILIWVLKNVNGWYYERNLGEKMRKKLPPGDLGWPFIGNMWFFLRAFKSSNPDSFVSYFVTRFSLSLSTHAKT